MRVGVPLVPAMFTYRSSAPLLPDGASVLVYGGLWASNRGLGADLAPNATTTIPLAALRHAAAEVEASA